MSRRTSRPGRPKKRVDQRLTWRLEAKVNEAIYRETMTAAKSLGMGISDYVRASIQEKNWRIANPTDDESRKMMLGQIESMLKASEDK